MFIRCLVFSCDLLSLYPVVHFLSRWLGGIIAVTNSNRDSASPWIIRQWIFASAKLFPPAVNSTLHLISCTFSGSLLSSFSGLCHMPFCSQSMQELDFAVSSCSHSGCLDQCTVAQLCSRIFYGIFFVLRVTIRGLTSRKSFPLFVQLVFSKS